MISSCILSSVVCVVVVFPVGSVDGTVSLSRDECRPFPRAWRIILWIFLMCSRSSIVCMICWEDVLPSLEYSSARLWRNFFLTSLWFFLMCLSLVLASDILALTCLRVRCCKVMPALVARVWTHWKVTIFCIGRLCVWVGSVVWDPVGGGLRSN